MPEFLNGDAIEKDALNSGTFDLMKWLSTHSQKETRPPLDGLIAGLKAQGVTSFAATGYCFGARYVVDLLLDSVIKVAIVAHPSLLKIPEDLEAIKAKSIPFLWNTCETDFMVRPPRARFHWLTDDSSAPSPRLRPTACSRTTRTVRDFPTHCD